MLTVRGAVLVDWCIRKKRGVTHFVSRLNSPDSVVEIVQAEARLAAAVPSRRATTPRGRPRSKPSPVLREESSDRGGTTAVGAAEILYLQTMSCFWVSSSSLMTATAATTAGSSRRSAVTCPFTSDATDDDEVAWYQVSHGPPFVVQTALRGRQSGCQSGCQSVSGSLHQTDNF